MRHLLSHAVNPALGLQKTVANWRQISMDLREPPRRRLLQTQKLRAMLYPGSILS
jgi:hypothetical protein